VAQGAALFVKALLVVPRLPGTGYTGDRVRAELHLSALGLAGFGIVLVGGNPAGRRVEAIEGVEARPVPLSSARVPGAVVSALVSGRPLQSGLFAGEWDDAIAAGGEGFDIVVALLPPRVFPNLLKPLPGAPLVVDFVDALGEAARQASRDDPALWRRAYWQVEAPRLLRAEREAAAGAAALLATTPFDASHLPAGTRALPNGVVIGQPPPRERGPVVAFSGRLRYRPNRLAARRLAEEIWPLVRRAEPEATLLLGGADVPPEILGLHGRGGVAVESPVPDMAAFLRRARVAAVPVDLGTGTPNKLFEAFEAGAAVVASEAVVARAAAGGEAPPALRARSNEEFAEGLVLYLRDPERAASDGARGRAWVEAFADRRYSARALAGIYRAALEGK
jgi:glycosyltransferase involved in cell wall biosynthesis